MKKITTLFLALMIAFTALHTSRLVPPCPAKFMPRMCILVGPRH